MSDHPADDQTRLPLANDASAHPQRIATMVVGFGARAALQALLFVSLARQLGAENYGSFVAVLALCMICAPFSGFGAWAVMVRDTSRRPQDFRAVVGGAIMVVAVSAPFIAAAAAGICRIVLPNQVAWMPIMAVAAAETICFPFNDLAVRAFQAFDRSIEMVAMSVFPVVARLASLGFLMLTQQHLDVGTWAVAYLCANVFSAVATMTIMAVRLGSPIFSQASIVPLMRESSPFALSLAISRAQSEIEKPMLLFLSTAANAGAYAAASRLVDLLLLPINAVMEASFSSFFRAGAAGAHASRLLALRLVKWLAAYSIVCAMLVILGAPFLPRLLGASFEPSVPLAMGLAGLPLLYGVYSVFAMIPQSLGRQRDNVPVIIGAGLVKVLVVLALVPRVGAYGAVIATYATFAVAAAWLGIKLIRIRSPHHAA